MTDASVTRRKTPRKSRCDHKGPKVQKMGGVICGDCRLLLNPHQLRESADK